MQGDVDFFEKRDLTIAVKLVDNEDNVTYVEDFPQYGYIFDSEKSYCINGAKISYSNGSATVSEVDGKEKCTLYFNEVGQFAKTIISNSTIVESTPDFSTVATEENLKLYLASDDYGTSLYFRGATTDNYVSFAGFYWRIGRINGNGLLSNPVGLITADEAAMAGGIESTNYSYYLRSGDYYWTASPHIFNGVGAAFVRVVYGDGYITTGTLNYSYAVRPVINLLSNVEFTGTGTIETPYEIITE